MGAGGGTPPPSLGMVRVNRALGTAEREVTSGPLRSMQVWGGSGLELALLGNTIQPSLSGVLSPVARSLGIRRVTMGQAVDTWPEGSVLSDICKLPVTPCTP